MFFNGDVYSSRWLYDSVREGKLQDADEYKVKLGCFYERRTTHIFPARPRVLYTMTEAIKLYRTVGGNTHSARSLEFWRPRIKQLNLRRTMESARSFYVKVLSKGLEQFLCFAVGGG